MKHITTLHNISPSFHNVYKAINNILRGWKWIMYKCKSRGACDFGISPCGICRSVMIGNYLKTIRSFYIIFTAVSYSLLFFILHSFPSSYSSLRNLQQCFCQNNTLKLYYQIQDDVYITILVEIELIKQQRKTAVYIL